MPKALYHRRTAEANFYHQFFARVVAWAEPSETAADLAEHEAVPSGLSALDALHVAAAMMLGADELVTTEGLRKPIHRVTGVRVIAS